MKFYQIVGFACGFGWLALAAPAGAAEEPAEKKVPGEKVPGENAAAAGHVFAWPFLSWEQMRPQGGATAGTAVTLRREPKEAWQRLLEDGLEKFERDRRAILALAGSYRVSFDFIETLGFAPDYQPPRPYFSWATEHVEVIADSGEFISLQHSLVMYFQAPDGSQIGPQVMKHWRQDWTWQDPEILTYVGPQTWQRAKTEAPLGRWSQAVFQVDDSPRYEVLGEWSHDGGLSTWRSDNAPRPLPRREFSTRSDYNILEGTHEITLAPTGWLHVQNNRKLRVDPDGTRSYVGTEIGVNRYEEISAPELAGPWQAYWAKTGDYWAAVRAAWAEVIAEHPRFGVRNEVDGRKLFDIHFARAAAIEEQASADAAGDVAHARATVAGFVEAAGAANGADGPATGDGPPTGN